MQNIFFAVNLHCFYYEFFGDVKVFSQFPRLNNAKAQRLFQLQRRHKFCRRPAVCAAFVSASDVQRRIGAVECARFAMTQLVGKMHPFFRLCFNLKRVDADVAFPRACHNGNRLSLRQIATDDFSAAFLRYFVKFSCFRFLPPPLLLYILRN